KSVRHIAGPTLQHAFFWHLVERIVNLHGRKLRGIELEHFLVGQLVGIKSSFPRFVGVTRSSHVQFTRLRHVGRPRVLTFLLFRLRHWRSAVPLRPQASGVLSRNPPTNHLFPRRERPSI